MMIKVKALLGILSLILSVQVLAFTQGFVFHKNSLKQDKSISRTMRTSFFEQKLDHKTPTDTNTFKQRYFVDSQFAESTSSPVFYVICGEWNCGGTASYGYAFNLAKKLKAHLVALEHRYYGESLPTTYLSTHNLQYLNLFSAVEDLAKFQKFMMTEQNLTGKWIAFGGSYAGTLSAFYRLKYPELVSGSIASSAPVYMKPEFNEYDAHIASVINRSSCGENVRRAVGLIEEKLRTPSGSKELKVLFKATEIKLDADFMYVVADMLAAAVQYGRDKMFCDALASATDPIEGYAKGGLLVLTALGARPVEISMQAAENLVITPKDYFRQWMWQSCSEFGWFQVANGTGRNTSRSSQVDLKYHAAVCQRLYQTQMTATPELNALWYAHLFNPLTERIVFTNGGNDPWLTLSLTPDSTQSNPNLDLFVMDQAAHCDDLRAVVNIPAVIAAQTQMDKIITQWLSN